MVKTIVSQYFSVLDRRVITQMNDVSQKLRYCLRCHIWVHALEMERYWKVHVLIIWSEDVIADAHGHSGVVLREEYSLLT